MRKLLPLLVLLSLVIAAAPKDKGKEIHKDWPTAGQVEKANDHVKEYQKDHKVSHTNAKGKEATFTPANIGDMNDEERGRGCIIGILDTERDTADGLTPGRYHAYLRKHNGKWQVFFCQKNEAVGFAKDVEHIDDNEHKPKFTSAGTRIRYWELSFSF
jgi:hypothetical protein